MVLLSADWLGKSAPQSAVWLLWCTMREVLTLTGVGVGIMGRPRRVAVGGWSGAMRAHDYSARALDAPDGDKVTIDPRSARDAFTAISTITVEAMEDWLARWPNALGWRRYRAAMRQAEHSRQQLTKIAVNRQTASRLRVFARKQGLTLDQTVNRLLDLV